LNLVIEESEPTMSSASSNPIVTFFSDINCTTTVDEKFIPSACQFVPDNVVCIKGSYFTIARSDLCTLNLTVSSSTSTGAVYCSSRNKTCILDRSTLSNGQSFSVKADVNASSALRSTSFTGFYIFESIALIILLMVVFEGR
jgi:hypothetical protein